jgi:hypothetical protein
VLLLLLLLLLYVALFVVTCFLACWATVIPSLFGVLHHMK